VVQAITFSTWLTLLRIILSPCVMMAINQSWFKFACMLFSCAAATDFFDGYYARLYNQETQLGKLLDPVADKILLTTTLFALSQTYHVVCIPWWFVCLIMSKEVILILGAVIVIMQKKSTILNPSRLSKWTTALFMLFMMSIMIVHDLYDWNFIFDLCIGFFSVATVMIISDYGYQLYQKIISKQV